MKDPSALIKVTSEEEKRLVECAQTGDGEAFSALYQAYLDRVYRFFFFRVREDQTAEDLTSLVFLKAWEHLERYETRVISFGAWLFRIARNLVIDHYRTRKETSSLDTPNAPEILDDAGGLEQPLEAEALRSMLGRLTQDQRTVLILKYAEGLDTAEIAHVMGKREGAVRALQMRGLQALAEMIEAENVGS